MAEPLSPAAKAVYDAFWLYERRYPDDLSTSDLANALRAAADQVVPLETVPKMMSGPDLERKVQRLHTRSQLLAIAAELEGHP